MCESNQIKCPSCANKESQEVCLDKNGYCPRCGWGLTVPKLVVKK